MKVVVIGLGVQGNKRKEIADQDFFASVDPVNKLADYQDVNEVPLAKFDAALLCTGDKPKVGLITYLLKNKKHVLVEKPLYATIEELHTLEKLANKNNVILYTAYNHRFEPHLMRMNQLIQSNQLGKIYQCRFYYGNGTARLVRQSAWRDQGTGVLHDLGSHLLDLTDYLFPQQVNHFKLISANCHENKAPDHVMFVNQKSELTLSCEMSLLSWRNEFYCDVIAEKGSAHIKSLCKWGPTEFIYRKRVLPSGRPPEESNTMIQNDPTWQDEYNYFIQLISSKSSTSLQKDIWLSQQLNALGAQIFKETECQIT